MAGASRPGRKSQTFARSTAQATRLAVAWHAKGTLVRWPTSRVTFPSKTGQTYASKAQSRRSSTHGAFGLAALTFATMCLHASWPSSLSMTSSASEPSSCRRNAYFSRSRRSTKAIRAPRPSRSPIRVTSSVNQRYTHRRMLCIFITRCTPDAARFWSVPRLPLM